MIRKSENGGIIYQIKGIINLGISLFYKRNPSKYVFGSWFGEKFADNPKYLYLYCLQHEIDAVWITKSESVYKYMRDKGYPVEMAFTKKSKKACSEAKYVIICTSRGDVDRQYIGNATIVNLWHGIPLKKVNHDDSYARDKVSKIQIIKEKFENIAYKKTYVVSTSNIISQIYKSAFNTDKEHILQLGQPRNDCFFDNSLKKIKYSPIDYDRVVLYLPTHRNQGKKPIDINIILNLEELNRFCAENKILFVIKKHFFHSKEKSNLKRYTNIIDLTGSECDTQELLFNADVLVTDYSSCYIDYLLLDRPIIFYNFDYDSYILNDREMYFDYDSVTPGPKCTNFDMLMNNLSSLFSGVDIYSEVRSSVRCLFYSSDNQSSVSESIISEIQRL